MATKIIGLTIGLAATILLVIFILHEGSYDLHFSQADRIYRLNSLVGVVKAEIDRFRF